MLTQMSRWGKQYLSAANRQRLRRMVDPVLGSVGSVHAARHATPIVALTFDDGPDAVVTPQVLEILRRHGARATFFVLSDHAERLPHLLRAIVAEGHEVGLHCDRHDRLTRLPAAEVRTRLLAAKGVIEGIAGRPVTLFRPPYGAQSLTTYFIARSLGLRIVVWGPYAEDWLDLSPTASAARVLDVVRGGDIALFHDGLELDPGDPRPSLDRARVIDLVLDGLAERGLVGDTVTAMTAAAGARTTSWFRA